MPERNQIIDDLRGICMLGVIGIHVGSFVLEAPYPNSFLYMLLKYFHAIVFPHSFLSPVMVYSANTDQKLL